MSAPMKPQKSSFISYEDTKIKRTQRFLSLENNKRRKTVLQENTWQSCVSIFNITGYINNLLYK